MSFTKVKREQIQRYILEKIDENRPDVAKRTAEAFGISLNTVYRYIRELEKNNVIEKEEDRYCLAETMAMVVLSREKNELTDEDLIYEKYISTANMAIFFYGNDE